MLPLQHKIKYDLFVVESLKLSFGDDFKGVVGVGDGRYTCCGVGV